MARHGVVTAELVGRRFFWRPQENDYGKWAAYRRLRALRELGLILSNKPLADRPAVLRVTREGARIADVGLRPAPLVLSELRHSLAVIGDHAVLVGNLPSRALKLVTEWAGLHHEELEADWQHVQDGTTPEPIDPLP